MQALAEDACPALLHRTFQAVLVQTGAAATSYLLYEDIWICAAVYSRCGMAVQAAADHTCLVLLKTSYVCVTWSAGFILLANSVAVQQRQFALSAGLDASRVSFCCALYCAPRDL